MCCCPLPSSSARSPVNGSATRSPPQRKRACGWAATCRWAMTPTSARSSSTLPRPRPCAASSLSEGMTEDAVPSLEQIGLAAALRLADHTLVAPVPIAFGEAIEQRHRIGNDTCLQRYSPRFGDCVHLLQATFEQPPRLRHRTDDAN